MTDTQDVKRRAIALVGEVSEDELTVRLIEAMGGLRPAGWPDCRPSPQRHPG